MRICLVYHGEFPPAERIEKIAKTLTAAGHKIFLLCNNYGKFTASEEVVGDVFTIRVRPQIRSRSISRIVKFPAFVSPLWLAELYLACRRHRIDAIQVIDLPLAGAAWAVGRLLGIPVVMDMWENYPEALKGWASMDWRRKIFKNPAVARHVELWLMPRLDHIFVVVEEQKERLIEDGVDPERISVVTNAVDVEMFTGSALRSDTPLDSEPGTYKLLYVGFLTIERGLDDIIRALPLLRNRIPSLRLFLAGEGSYEPRLRTIVAEEGVSDMVRFAGWVPFRDIHSWIAKSDLCVVPHLNNTFINTTFPNKLFQYMLMGKPSLVSNAKPLARVVRECDCGFVFRSGDPADAAAAILKAYEARHDATIGGRGRRCVEAKYTWDHVAPELVRVWDRIGKTRAAAA
jgi:glycosyltransferase involved in cell wall biosynthesis